MGLYALVNNKIAGAIWSRKFTKEHNAKAFVDEKTPVLSMAVLPEFKNQNVTSIMMQQFLEEASALYENLSLYVNEDIESINFYESFGFSSVSEREKVMTKTLEKKEIIRPSDGYDANRWMD